MNTEKAAKELLSTGTNLFMTMHIIRYSKEEKISIHEIIQKFKDASIHPDHVAHLSCNGYESFKSLISMISKEAKT